MNTVLQYLRGQSGSTSSASSSRRLYAPLDSDGQAGRGLSPPAPSLLPCSRRFWADFTLGFSDGLTVPFALTAGLSSLGRTDTVLFAGLAEISAGCISMGIGGYLSARQTAEEATDDEIEQDEQEQSEKADAVVRYLAPLGLPVALQQHVLDHVAESPRVVSALCHKAGLEAEDDNSDNRGVWPVTAGLSVAAGYLLGGMLPLWPYFFVQHVGDGLRWSIAVCVLALFLFGFARDYCLSAAAAVDGRQGQCGGMVWRRLRRSVGEGVQMVVLGGIAAMAAVLCVRLFESSESKE